MNLFELPVDQYQRYRIAADTVNALRPGSASMRILEVGGFPPRLGQFLPDDDVTITDCEGKGGADFIQADALALPFADKSFDTAVALDVLEHIPPDEREAFVSELCRVAASHVIIAAPFDDGKGVISGAEELLKDYIKDARGYEHEYLTEHLKYGLPSIEKIIKILDAEGWRLHTLPNGYFMRWFVMILAEYAFERNEQYKEIIPKLREYYNYYFYTSDNREPAYRHVVAASRDGFNETQRCALSGIAVTAHSHSREWPPLEYATTLIELARLGVTTRLENEIDGLKHDLAARDEELRYLKQYASEMEEFVEKVKSALPYRLYRFLFKR